MCVLFKNESFPLCARAQIKCFVHTTFRCNATRKSFKNLTRDTAIPRAECRRCRLSFRGTVRQKKRKQAERNEASHSQSPGFLIYINYTQRSFCFGQQKTGGGSVPCGPLFVLLRQQLFSQSVNMINREGLKMKQVPTLAETNYTR